jgi:glycosyltransferase 2 family protein
MLKSKIRSSSWFLAKAAVSIAFLFYATRKIDLTSITEDVRALNPFLLLLALGQLLLIPILGGARWRLVLRVLGTPIDLLSATRLFWVGMMCSQVLPSTSGGDAIRIVLAWRTGIPFARSAHSVILERLAMLFTLISLVAFILVLGVKQTSIPGARWLGPLLLCGAACGMMFLMLADRIFANLPSWKILRVLSELSFDARKLLFSSSSARLIGWSVLTHLNLAIAALWLGKAIGIHLSFLDYVFYISLITLITSLPLSIGGWGIREGVVVALFGSAGVPAHSALAFSILYGLSVAAISLGGFPFVSLKKADQKAGEEETDGQIESTRKLPCFISTR